MNRQVWLSNGSMIIYATIYQGRKSLALVSTDGRFKAVLPTSSGEIRCTNVRLLELIKIDCFVLLHKGLK